MSISKTYWGVLVSLVAIPLVAHAQINNPLGANVTFAGILVNFTNFLLGLVAILALLGAVWSGIRMILSIGNEQGVAQAKKILLWSVAGLIVAGLSYAIIIIISRNLLGVAGV